jgi:hypothetical protein
MLNSVAAKTTAHNEGKAQPRRRTNRANIQILLKTAVSRVVLPHVKDRLGRKTYRLTIESPL